MSRRKKKKPSPPVAAAPSVSGWSGETRAADTVTVGWMLAALTTLVAVLAWGIAFGYARWVRPDQAQSLGVGYLMIAMLACGALTFALGVIAGQIRRRPAPPTIRRATMLIAALPWISAGVALLLG